MSSVFFKKVGEFWEKKFFEKIAKKCLTSWWCVWYNIFAPERPGADKKNKGFLAINNIYDNVIIFSFRVIIIYQ